MGARTIVISALAVAASLAGCASSTVLEDAGREEDAGSPRRDSGPPAERDAGREDDAGAPQPDAGSSCADNACGPFQYCDEGRCRDYPSCGGDGTCPRPGDVCRNRRCVPGDVDIDGDGSPAELDCDEANPNRFPGNTEVCSALDEDCDGTVDEGDPATLCESDPHGGICQSSSCGCPEGTYDVDRSVPGCECVAAPPLDQGTACASAIDLGDIADSGEVVRVSGNVMPHEREVWYRFRGVDTTDTSCDNYHVRVLLLTNPDDTFEFTVFRGSCTTPACDDSGVTDFRWATDFRQTIDGRLAGQCPCATASGVVTAPPNTSICAIDTAVYYVRVRRRASAAVGCQEYTLEVSNGIYHT